jgi:hypothetical protein
MCVHHTYGYVEDICHLYITVLYMKVYTQTNIPKYVNEKARSGKSQFKL